MYIPKKNRFEMFLRRKSSTSSHESNNNGNNSNNNHYNWSEACTEFIKDVVLLRRRLSLNSSSNTNSKGRIANGSSSSFKNNNDMLNNPNLCLDQLSEFQKSYVSFPEFSDASTISNDSELTNNTSGVQSIVGGNHYCITTTSNL